MIPIQNGQLQHVDFLATANLKTESMVNEIEGELWFTVANVVLRTQTMPTCAATVAHRSTRWVKSTGEANENTTGEWKANASAYPTAA
jgi:hypothetical protein